ncbi:MAG TPA: hypothetical protein VN611_14635 [Patescibacteria group bacterium]|nr:hypothetical protein [Patescibacteria group bacterium]
MRNKKITIGRFLLLLCLVVTGYSPAASSAAPNLQQSSDLYRPVTVERAGDIIQLAALTENYIKAWKNYINNGDRDIFRYIKPAGPLSDQVIIRMDNGPISYVSDNLSAIRFADQGEKAYLDVAGNIVKAPLSQGAHYSNVIEYSWTYEAERKNNNWMLSKCTPNVEIADRVSYGDPRSFFVNGTEILLGDKVYYANPHDANKLYCSNLAGNDVRKLLDDSVIIASLAYSKAIVYINKTRNNEVWLLDSHKLTTKKVALEFPDKDGSYFTDGYAIFRTKGNGREIQRIYSYALTERSPLTLLNVRDGWLYFSFFSGGGKHTYRIKTDGTATELLPDIKTDWRDEEY